MERTLREIAEMRTYNLSFKLGALSHLFDSYSPNGQSDADVENIQGLGPLLDDLAKEGKRIGELLERGKGKLGTKVDLKDYENDPIGAAFASLGERG